MFDHDEQDWCIHRTLVEFLIQSRQPEVAAALLEGAVKVEPGSYDHPGIVFVEVPPAAYPLVGASDDIQQVIRRAMREVLKGNFVPDPEIELRMQVLSLPSPEWEEEMKTLITQFKGSNQGLLSELIGARQGRPVHTWNELKYASASEIRIAQELEKRHILFFPLAVAVRAETGSNWQDHREVDFLICHKGTWGIIEVSFHPGRYEKDSEKDAWFKRSGVLCISHYTAERCYKEATSVIEEFLAILKQHEK